MKTFSDYLAEAVMNPQTALKIFGLADFPKTADELKRLHKKLAMKNHPDKGGSLEKMKDINTANDVLKKYVGMSAGNVSFSTAASGPIKQDFGGFHTLRKYGHPCPRGKMPEEVPKEEVCKWMRLHMLTFFHKGLSLDKFCSYLQSVFGPKFKGSVETRQIATTDAEKRLNDIKEPWMTASFRSVDGKYAVDVFFTGNTDKATYKNRNNLDGYYYEARYEFEFKLSANAYSKNGKKITILKPTKYFRRKDAKILDEPSILLPKDKLRKAYGI